LPNDKFQALLNKLRKDVAKLLLNLRYHLSLEQISQNCCYPLQDKQVFYVCACEAGVIIVTLQVTAMSYFEAVIY
jgi:hypothetical protein